MWDNFRVRRWYYIYLHHHYSLLGKATLTLHPEAVSFSSTSLHFLAQTQNTGWITWSTAIIYYGNVTSLSMSSFVISNIQATILCVVIVASAFFMLDEATNQPSWKPSLPQPQLKLPVLVTFFYVTPFYFLPCTYQNLIWLICLVNWCLLVMSPHWYKNPLRARDWSFCIPATRTMFGIQ